MRLTKLRTDGTPSCGGKVWVKLTWATVAFLLATVALPPTVLHGEESKPAGSIVCQFPAPGPSPCGLAWDGKQLWVADDGTDTIYQLNPTDGSIISSFKTPGDQPRGLAFDGTHLWYADNGTQKLQKLQLADGPPLAELAVPLPRVKGRQPEVGGLACDGQYLWTGTVAGWSSKMNQVDPRDGTVKRSYYTKGYPRALATDGEFIWNATDNGGKRLGLVYQYNLSDGLFVSQFDTPGYYPTGLVFDGECLWCVDRETKTIYRLTAR